MKTFRVYKSSARGVAAVKDGFSWPAFFFGWFWMVVSGLWGRAILWFILWAAFAVVAQLFGPLPESTPPGVLMAVVCGVFAFHLTLWLAPAFGGNRWLADRLKSQGYLYQSTTRAASKEAAISLWQQSSRTTTTTNQLGPQVANVGVKLDSPVSDDALSTVLEKKLSALKGMHDRGLLTESEYSAKKAALLSDF